MEVQIGGQCPDCGEVTAWAPMGKKVEIDRSRCGPCQQKADKETALVERIAQRVVALLGEPSTTRTMLFGEDVSVAPPPREGA